ncbi:MAG: M4 family metallopeptidase [Deltaproteobacteria bacterium]|nr:M4 family metallopeptidase [Deltaproteobacteria bacterium]
MLAAELAPLELVYSHAVRALPGKLGEKWPVFSEGSELDKYTLALGGIPVRGVGVRVLRDARGATRVVSALRLGGSAREVTVKPTISEKQAGEIAVKHALSRLRQAAGKPPTVRRTRLAYEAVTTEDLRGAGQRIVMLRLTYEVELLATPEEKHAEQLAVIDAANGELLGMRSVLRHDMAVGQGYFEPSMTLRVEPTMTGSPPVLGHCLTDLTRGENVSNASPCGPTVGTGIHTFIELPSPERVERVVDTDLHFGNGAFPFDRPAGVGEEGRTVAADAHHAIGVAYDFFRNVFDRRILGVNDSLAIRVNSANLPWNAAFSWPDNTIVVGSRVVNAPSCPALSPTQRTDCSVPAADVEWLGHEYVHALLTAELSMPPNSAPESEFDALHEAISDFFAILIDGWWHNAPGTTDIVAPRGWFFADRIYPDKWRQFDRPSLDGLGSLDLYDPTVPVRLASRMLGTHEAGGVVRRAFYFLSEGIAPSGPTAPQPLPANTSLLMTEGLAGVGLSDAAVLLYLTVSTQFNPGAAPSFLEFREGMVRSAEYLRGHCSETYKAVQDAWAAVGLGTQADRVGPKVSVTAYQVGSSAHVVGHIDAPASEPTPYVSLYVDGQLRESGVPVELEETSGDENNYRAAPADVPFADLGPGLHTFELRAEDGCRNVRSAAALAFYDVEPPTQLSVTDTNRWRSPKRVFRVTAADPNLDSYEVRVGTLSTGPRLISTNVSSLNTTVEMDLASLPAGTTTITLRVRDVYGHESTLLAPYLVDRVAPQVCSVSGAPSPTDLRAIVATLTGSDYLIGRGTSVEILDIWFDGQPFWWTDRNYPPGSSHYMTRTRFPGGGTMSKNVPNVSNGTHKLLGKCVDGWGNEKIGKDSFVMAPPPNLSTTASIQTGSFTVSATATSTRPIDQIEFLENGALLSEKLCGNVSTSCSASIQVSASPGQTRTIEVRAFDKEGRRTTRNVTVTMPLPPPPQITSIQKSGPARFPIFTVYATSTSRVDVMYGSPGGTLLAQDSSAPFTVQLDLSGWATGAHALVFRASDAYGREATSTYSLFADSTPPVVAVQVTGNAPPYLVDADVLDNSPITVFFREDGVEFATTSSAPLEAYYSPTSAGSHTLTVEVRDVFFNSTIVELPAPVDEAPPRVTLTFETSGGPHHVIDVEDTCGIAFPAQVFLDGAPAGSFATALHNQPWPNLPAGPHTVGVEVSDNCGNTTYVEDEFQYSNAPPEVLSISVDSATPKRPRLTIDATDDVAITRIEILRGSTIVGTLTQAPWVIQLDTSSWSDGNHVVTVRAFDEEGETGERTVNIKADNTAPTFSVVPIHQVLGTIQWNATASDGSALSDVWLGATFNNTPITHFTAPPYSITTTIPSGANQVDVWVAGEAKDSFGNVRGLSVMTTVTCSIVNGQRRCDMGPLRPGF